MEPVYLDDDEINEAYSLASDEADQWRIDYPEYERLADNGLMDDLDENLPEVNDGSLAASLFKLAKRVIKKKMSGRATALDRDDEWLTELANIYWENKILPNAKSKATPRRKWKDAARKAAIYGGQPIVTLFLTRGNYTGADFIVPYAQDVKLEAGKDSDEDSDIIFWDVYYSKNQLRNMIAQAEEEIKDGDGAAMPPTEYDKSTNDTGVVPTDPVDAGKATAKNAKAYDNEDSEDDDEQEEGSEPYNLWDVQCLKDVLAGEPEEQRPGNEQSRTEEDKGHKKTGYRFHISFQRGVDAPFTLMSFGKKKPVRKWTNPDPTGDVPVHYLYMYQDFINPYGVGIVKLAGGTQNVLDYMRQADILATQLGLRPPKQISGDEDQVDEDSLVYTEDANWYVGTAKVERMELADGIYNQLPGRMSMYKTSLNQLIPTGDTSIESGAGDPNYSKTPAGVKFQQANLSIDDEDFEDNIDECYATVAKSMINTQFANMQGTDLLKLSEDERDTLQKAGLQFNGDSRELNVIWDHARATFDFEVDADADDPLDDQSTLDGKMKTYELIQQDPDLATDLAQNNKKLDKGELLTEILHTLTQNDKIIVDITQEEAQKIIQDQQQKSQAEVQAKTQAAQQPPKPLGESVAWKPGDLREGERSQALQQVGIKADDPNAPSPNEDQQAHDQAMGVVDTAHKIATTPPPAAPGQQQQPGANAASTPAPDAQQGSAQDKQAMIAQDHIEQVMKLYKVDAHTAAAMLEAERQGYKPEEIIAALKRQQQPRQPVAAIPEGEVVNG